MSGASKEASAASPSVPREDDEEEGKMREEGGDGGGGEKVDKERIVQEDSDGEGSGKAPGDVVPTDGVDEDEDSRSEIRHGIFARTFKRILTGVLGRQRDGVEEAQIADPMGMDVDEPQMQNPDGLPPVMPKDNAGIDPGSTGQKPVEKDESTVPITPVAAPIAVRSAPNRPNTRLWNYGRSGERDDAGPTLSFVAHNTEMIPEEGDANSAGNGMRRKATEGMQESANNSPIDKVEKISWHLRSRGNKTIRESAGQSASHGADPLRKDPSDMNALKSTNNEASTKTNQTIYNSVSREDSRAGSVKTENIDMENLESIELERLTYKQLQKVCRNYKVPASGRKAVLVSRLRARQKDDRASNRVVGKERSRLETGDEQSMDMYEDDGVSRVDTSAPQKSSRPPSNRKRERDVGSIEPIIRGENSIAKSQDGTIREDNKDQGGDLMNSGLNYVVEMSTAVKRGRKSITASEFEVFTRVLLEGVQNEDRDRAVDTLSRLYDRASPPSKKKMSKKLSEVEAEKIRSRVENSIGATAIRTGYPQKSEPQSLAPSRTSAEEQQKRIVAPAKQEKPFEARTSNIAPKSGPDREGEMARSPLQKKPIVAEPKPGVPGTPVDSKPPNIFESPLDSKLPSKQTRTEPIRSSAMNTPRKNASNIVEAFLQTSSTFIPRSSAEDGTDFYLSGDMTFRSGISSERPSRRKAQSAVSLRRWRRRDELHESETLPVTDLRGKLETPTSNKVVVSAASKRIMETLEKLSTPRVGGKRNRESLRAEDSGPFTEPKQSSGLMSSRVLRSRNLRLNAVATEEPLAKSRHVDAGSNALQTGNESESRLQRIRRQAMSRMTAKDQPLQNGNVNGVTVDAARERLSSTLKEKVKSAEKSVKWQESVGTPSKLDNTGTPVKLDFGLPSHSGSAIDSKADMVAAEIEPSKKRRFAFSAPDDSSPEKPESIKPQTTLFNISSSPASSLSKLETAPSAPDVSKPSIFSSPDEKIGDTGVKSTSNNPTFGFALTGSAFSAVPAAGKGASGDSTVGKPTFSFGLKTSEQPDAVDTAKKPLEQVWSGKGMSKKEEEETDEEEAMGGLNTTAKASAPVSLEPTEEFADNAFDDEDEDGDDVGEQKAKDDDLPAPITLPVMAAFKQAMAPPPIINFGETADPASVSGGLAPTANFSFTSAVPSSAGSSASAAAPSFSTPSKFAFSAPKPTETTFGASGDGGKETSTPSTFSAPASNSLSGASTKRKANEDTVGDGEAKNVMPAPMFSFTKPASEEKDKESKPTQTFSWTNAMSSSSSSDTAASVGESTPAKTTMFPAFGSGTTGSMTKQFTFGASSASSAASLGVDGSGPVKTSFGGTQTVGSIAFGGTATEKADVNNASAPVATKSLGEQMPTSAGKLVSADDGAKQAGEAASIATASSGLNASVPFQLGGQSSATATVSNPNSAAGFFFGGASSGALSGGSTSGAPGGIGSSQSDAAPVGSAIGMSSGSVSASAFGFGGTTSASVFGTPSSSGPAPSLSGALASSGAGNETTSMPMAAFGMASGATGAASTGSFFAFGQGSGSASVGSTSVGSAFSGGFGGQGSAMGQPAAAGGFNANQGPSVAFGAASEPSTATGFPSSNQQFSFGGASSSSMPSTGFGGSTSSDPFGSSAGSGMTGFNNGAQAPSSQPGGGFAFGGSGGTNTFGGFGGSGGSGESVGGFGMSNSAPGGDFMFSGTGGAAQAQPNSQQPPAFGSGFGDQASAPFGGNPSDGGAGTGGSGGFSFGSTGGDAGGGAGGFSIGANNSASGRGRKIFRAARRRK